MKIFSKLVPEIPEMELESGVQRIIGILNSRGLPTKMSCEGHSDHPVRQHAWVELESAHFIGYMAKKAKKMERFIRAGEGHWSLVVEYYAKSHFNGLGRPKPRVHKLKRVVYNEMAVRIYLTEAAHESGTRRKTKAMIALEKAAEKFL